MLEMAVRYRAAIDDITANKTLKLRKFELDDEDWEIVSDLIRVLKVRLSLSTLLVNLQVIDV
jgi:hypothetical protein